MKLPGDPLEAATAQPPNGFLSGDIRAGMAGIPASEYHERSKHTPERIKTSGFRLDFENKPLPYKIYQDLPKEPLPGADAPVARAALEAIAEPDPMPTVDRTDSVLTQVNIDQFCHLATGITKNFSDETVDVDPVATPRAHLLHAVQPLYHAAACTGKLYHIDCYLVGAEIDGLPAGVYHFEPLTRSLDVLRRGDYRGVVAAATGEFPAASEAPLHVIATSTWWRNAWKYRDRTYRHAFWDSGTVVANLLAVAHGLGWRAEVVTGFADESIARLLGVDPESEAPVELVTIGRGHPAPEPKAMPTIDPATRPLSPEPVEYPTVYEAWTAGTLPDGDAARTWRDNAPIEVTDQEDGPTQALAPDRPEDRPETTISRTIRRRGSCRSYRRETVPFSTISTILDRGVRGVPIDIDDTDRALTYTDCYLISNGVEGLGDGAYQYHPDDGTLERLRSGPAREAAGHLALDQQLGADAAVCVYFLADVDAVTEQMGDRGYRVAQFEAAATAGRLYLATYAFDDLGGTGLTFYDDAVSEFFEPRASGQTPMFLYTIGRPG